METRFKIHVQAKVLSLILLALIISSYGCYAQEQNTLIKSIIIDGNESNVLSEAAYIKSQSLNYSISTLLELKNEADIKSLLGDPIDEINKQTKSSAGFVLFENKQLIYDGLIFNLEKFGPIFEVTNIDFTNNRTVLKFDSIELKIGDTFSITSNSINNLSFRINITEQLIFGQDKLKQLSNDQVRSQFFKLSADENGVVQSITLVMKSI